LKNVNVFSLKVSGGYSIKKSSDLGRHEWPYDWLAIRQKT